MKNCSNKTKSISIRKIVSLVLAFLMIFSVITVMAETEYSAPVITSPTKNQVFDGENIEDITFSWKKLSGAKGYSYELFDETNNKFVTKGFITDTSVVFQESLFKPNHTYSASVVAMISQSIEPDEAGILMILTEHSSIANVRFSISEQTVHATSVYISPNRFSIKEGETSQLKATLTPSNALITTIKWASSDHDVAIVNELGVVTAIKAGTATITARTSNGKYSSCVVTVLVGSLDTPVITYPKNSETLLSGKLTVTWKAVPGTQLYDFELFDLTTGRVAAANGAYGTSQQISVYANHTYRITTQAHANINSANMVSSNKSIVFFSAVSSLTEPSTVTTLIGTTTETTTGLTTETTTETTMETTTFQSNYTFEGANLPTPNFSVNAGSAPVIAKGIKATSRNKNLQDYTSYASRPITSYLSGKKDGSFERLEYINNKIVVEQYNNKLQFLSTKDIKVELPEFGGAYYGENYNFIVFGQSNPYENNSLATFKIVKYDKGWNKLDEVDFANNNTTGPFDFGSLRMAEYGDKLYIRTSHIMYKSGDGLNHQANVSILVSTSNMSILDSVTGVGGGGYVSHSFNQFILTAGNKVAAVDHGDAYPRAIVLSVYKASAGSNNIFTSGGCDTIQLMKFPGNVGENYTGAALSGFEVSDSSYIIAGNSVAQNSSYKTNKTRNVFLSTTSINNPSTSNTAIKWLTNYSENGKNMTTAPQLVKIDNNNFLVLWSEDDVVKYVTVDGNGNTKSSISSMNGSLSDCKPILVGTSILWYLTDNNAPAFYAIDVANPAKPSPIEIKPIVSQKSDMSEIRFMKGYGDGSFKPSQSATRYEVIEALNNLFNFDRVSGSTAFNDVNYNYISLVANFSGAGIINGYPDGTFGGTKSITRAEFVIILSKLLNIDNESSSSKFNDISGHWAESYINAFSAKGHISGYPDGTFKPNSPITRAEAVALISRIAGTNNTKGSVSYSDVKSNFWAYDLIMSAGN